MIRSIFCSVKQQLPDARLFNNCDSLVLGEMPLPIAQSAAAELALRLCTTWHNAVML